MGTPTHTYCSLRDLLKNQPSPSPKFKNHSFSRTKVELQDLYTNMSIDLSVLDGSSSREKPTSNSRDNNAKGKSKKPADDHDEKGPMVDPFLKGCICHTKKSIERSAENGKKCLEMGPADKGGANEDSEEEDNKDKEKEVAAESEEEETEEASVMLESEEETEERMLVVESDEE